MAEAKKITAVNIKKLWYGETSAITEDLTGQALYTLLQGETLKEVKNIHQDTWTLEEAEASRTNYKNQLTGQTYRSDKGMGDVTVNFTIGEYDYPTKKDLMGGDVINTDKGWKRARGKVNIEKLIPIRLSVFPSVLWSYSRKIRQLRRSIGSIPKKLKRHELM